MSEPDRYDVVVVGGGPAGSTAAAIAARNGARVLLLEAGMHPREHVGESLLPGIIPILEEMGALADIEAAGFTEKTGGTYYGWGQTPRWDLWFSETEHYDYAWLVERSRFDAILFEAAGRAGATSLQRATVREFLLEDDRVVGVRYRHEGEERIARAPLTVDASGRATKLAKHRGTIAPIEGLDHMAGWARFENANTLPAPRACQAWFVARPTHWVWVFRLSEGVVSVGVVTTDGRTLDFDALLREDDEVSGVLGPDAKRVTPVRWERDWSYRAQEVAAPGVVLAGDAAGFIDPVLSTGVMLAMHGGYAAAQTALALRDGKPEGPALDAYQARHRGMFDDMLRMVRFFYQQNLRREDYFWESKKILLREDTELRPQRAFMVLTSGLIGNLAFDAKRLAVDEDRRDKTDGGTDLSEAPHESLAFVCLRFSHRGAALYMLIEPKEPASPTLFSTDSFHFNCLAPRYDNDPIREPSIAPTLRGMHTLLDRLDDGTKSLAAFWRAHRDAIAAHVDEMPPEFELVRVFGE